MWQLNRIDARNICAFRQVGYTLKQGVTTLIFGDNRDNESQRSNGSGKSALLECIAIGITGSPLRKIKNEEIINDAAQGCRVLLEFQNRSCNEVFRVEREISRKGASVVRCSIDRDGKRVETDEAVQHSVDAYNGYILEKLGITREELFNNFLLSKHRYADFLSASDKEKKEIINRFSNGIVVDEAIEKVLEDIAPVEQGLKAADLELAGLDGRTGMLSEQIQSEEQGKEERARTRQEKVSALQRSIADKREVVRMLKRRAAACAEISVCLEQVDKDLQLLENSDEPLEGCVSRVQSLLLPYGKLTDWESVVSEKRNEIAETGRVLSDLGDRIAEAESGVQGHHRSVEGLKSEHREFVEASTRKSEVYKGDLDRLEKQLTEIQVLCCELREKRRMLSSAVEWLSNRIAGTIACPRCKHEFLVSDSVFDVQQGRIDVEQKRRELESVGNRISDTDSRVTAIEQSQTEILNGRRALNGEHSVWLGKISAAEKLMQAAVYEWEGLQRKQQLITERAASIRLEIEGVRRRMFDEGYEILDSAIRSNEREIKTANEDVAATESSIETLETTIGELNRFSSSGVIDSLKASLKTYRKKSAEVLASRNEIEQELYSLREQEQRFAQFKSYLANTKIEALSKITNEFLENIGSDIRIQFSGYTVLKTGKVREKISVTLLRDGIDCGSFGKFSEGEKARVNLSSILAMQKLVNSHCADEKGLDLLVLDEILAAVDEEGNTKMFEALNRLGITALVVSHGHVSESYPHTLLIQKEHGESRIV